MEEGPCAGGSFSWTRKYFETKDVTVKNKKMGTEEVVKSDVCKLPMRRKPDVICGAIYKHNLSNGTKTLQRHLINNHRTDPAISAEILSRGIKLKVKNVC